MEALYTISAILAALTGVVIVGITRHTLGRARTGGWLLTAAGVAHIGMSYTVNVGRYDGVSLWCTYAPLCIVYWLYVRNRIAQPAVPNR